MKGSNEDKRKKTDLINRQVPFGNLDYLIK